MTHEESVFRGAGGLELFTQSWRAPGRPPSGVLVLVHGLGDHSGLYPTVVEHFTERGWAVEAFDLRGNGRSPGRRGHVSDWREFRDDLGCFVTRARGRSGAPLFLLGNSLGGLIVLDYALHHPAHLAGVVAAAPPLGRLGVPGWLLLLGRALSRVWPTFTRTTGMDLSKLSRDPEAARLVLEDPLFHRRATARLATEVLGAIDRVRRGAPRISVPTLLVHGGADQMVLPDGSRRFVRCAARPTVEYREYPGAYHALFVDPGYPEVLRDVEAWMRRTVDRSGTRLYA